MEIGRWLLGIRTDSPTVLDALGTEYADRLAADPEPPPGFAVVTAHATDQHGTRTLGTLRSGNDEVLRSRSDGRLARALLHVLTAFADTPSDVIALGAAAVVRENAAVLLPTRWLWEPGVEGHLRGSNTVVLDTTTVRVTSDTSVIHAVGWDLDRGREAVIEAPVVAWLLQQRPLLADDQRVSSLVATAALGFEGTPPRTVAQAQASLEHVPHLIDLIHVVDKVPDARSIVREIDDAFARAGSAT